MSETVTAASGAARSAWRISVASLVWTLVAGAGACAVGLLSNSLVLLSFGAIGLLDAAGSATLVIHFRHSLRHEAASDSHERIALNVVTTGMFVIGVATAVESIHRLTTVEAGGSTTAGIALAGISVFVLAGFSLSKRRIAGRVLSQALLADAWLSGMGSLLALVTLTGTVLAHAIGWTWVDPGAATVVAAGAIALSIQLRRGAV